MVKEMVKKKEFRKTEKQWNSFVSLIDKDESAIDCEIACDCVKRANVVLSLRREIFATTHTATHKPASAQRLKVTIVTSINRLWSPWAFGLMGQ